MIDAHDRMYMYHIPMGKVMKHRCAETNIFIDIKL